MVIHLCMIKNDSFQKINMLHVNQMVDQPKVGQPNVGQHREVNLSQQYS